MWLRASCKIPESCVVSSQAWSAEGGDALLPCSPVPRFPALQGQHSPGRVLSVVSAADLGPKHL